MSDDHPTPEEQRWLSAWADKRRQAADGTRTPEDVHEWVWKNKVLNAINVTIQRIKRSERPGRDPRLTDNTWVTIAAERGSTREETTPLAVDTLNYVTRKLEARGHEFDVDWMVSSRGVIVISINVKALRPFMNRKTPEAQRNPDPPASLAPLDLFDAGAELMRPEPAPRRPRGD